MRFFAFRSIEDLEKEQATLQLQRVKDGFSFTEELMKQTANDWSKWDETYDFVEGANPLFPESNFYIDALDSIKMNMAIIYSLDKTRIYEIAYDFNEWEQVNIDQSIINQIEQSDFINHYESMQTYSGLLTNQEQLMIVVASPIMRSDYGGEPNGTLVFVKIVDDELIDSLQRITGITFSIAQNETLDEDKLIQLTELGSYRMNVKGLIQDINLNHNLLLDMDISMEASIIIRDSISYVTSIIAIILFMFLIILVFMLDQQMFKRIYKMRDNIIHLEELNDIKLRLDADDKKDEISYIGSEINRLIDKLESSYNEINRIAYLDHLTGTHNRLAFHRYLDDQIKIEGNRFSILFIDLDNFKIINDQKGHEIGDTLLVEVSKRIQQIIGALGIISRTGGDEFLIYLQTSESKVLSEITRSLIESIAEPYSIDGFTLYITASIGVAQYPENGASTKELIKNADLAMYYAKSLGKNQVQNKHE